MLDSDPSVVGPSILSLLTTNIFARSSELMRNYVEPCCVQTQNADTEAAQTLARCAPSLRLRPLPLRHALDVGH